MDVRNMGDNKEPHILLYYSITSNFTLVKSEFPIK